VFSDTFEVWRANESQRIELLRDRDVLNSTIFSPMRFESLC
jgi:hypothetical protein